jgi:hypothetical protein
MVPIASPGVRARQRVPQERELDVSIEEAE